MNNYATIDIGYEGIYCHRATDGKLVFIKWDHREIPIDDPMFQDSSIAQVITTGSSVNIATGKQLPVTLISMNIHSHRWSLSAGIRDCWMQSPKNSKNYRSPGK